MHAAHNHRTYLPEDSLGGEVGLITDQLRMRAFPSTGLPGQ